MTSETERALRESKDKFEALFKESPLGIYTFDTNGIIDSFNPEMVRLAGAAEEKDVVGLNALELPSYKEAGLTDHFRTALEGKSFDLPCVKYKSFTNAKISYRSYRGVPLYDETGHVHHVMCMVLDITERVEIEEARQHALRLATIIEQSPDAILILRPDARRTIEYWNTGAEKMFGWKSGEAVGESVREFIVPEQFRADADSFVVQLQTESLVHVETIRQHRDGHLIPIELYIFPIRHESGAIVQLAAILRDISERKKSEQQMFERDATLKKINNFMVGRELKMIELKEQLKKLKKQLEEASSPPQT